MAKLAIECLRGRNKTLDEAETKTFEVKDFAEATALLEKDLAATAEEEWSAQVLKQWCKLSHNPRIEEVQMVDEDVTWVFRYES